MNRKAGDFALRKLLRVGAADLLKINRGNGYIQLPRDVNEYSKQPLVRAPRPDLVEARPRVSMSIVASVAATCSLVIWRA